MVSNPSGIYNELRTSLGIGLKSPGATAVEMRTWRKNHSGAAVEVMRRYDEKHPGVRTERMREWRRNHLGAAKEVAKRYREKYPRVRAEKMREYNRTNVHTYVESKRVYLPAPHKREQVDTCELCGKPVGEKTHLGWHHWDNSDASKGLWICFNCNIFAEAVDIGGQELVRKYIGYKELLGEEYANGQVVEDARLNRQYRRVGTTINGIQGMYRAWGKRDRPKDSLCELCNTTKCSIYHHWDDSILGKGLWVCQRCDKFAERFDAYGEAFVDKYLSLKRQDELRVIALSMCEVKE